MFVCYYWNSHFCRIFRIQMAMMLTMCTNTGDDDNDDD